jgi:GxxExxY protein
MVEELIYKDISYKLVGAAMEVHKTLGPGFLEGAYQRAYEAELKIQKIPFVAQKKIKISYKSVDLGFQVLDLVADCKIIIEIKSVLEILPIHQAQLISYLKATDYVLGILINFGAKSLQYKRMVVTKPLCNQS